MGLDMYLERMPRYKDATARDVNAVKNYLDWEREKAAGSKYANCTFKEWCGIEKIPSKEYVDFYSQYYTEGNYGFHHITEEAGYWRKANAIHNWFVENVQDGIDDCEYHHEVTAEALEELLDACKTVLDAARQPAKEFKNGVWLPVVDDDGAIGKDFSVARRLLPTQGGFFFGSVDYDEYYLHSIEHTIEIVTNALETTDFDTEMIYYCSSW